MFAWFKRINKRVKKNRENEAEWDAIFEKIEKQNQLEQDERMYGWGRLFPTDVRKRVERRRREAERKEYYDKYGTHDGVGSRVYNESPVGNTKYD